MKEVYKFKIDKALSEAVEARQLELTGLERLYWSTLSTTAYIIPPEKIKTLQDEYIKVNAEYEMLKTKINNLIPEQYLDAKYHWNLDFASNEVTISES